MAIPANNRNNYIGNGSTPDYDYTFKIFAATDLRVAVLIAGEKTVLTKDTHYTVDPTGIGINAGGTISLVDGDFDWLDDDGNLDDDVELALTRRRPLTQTTNIRNQGDYFPDRHEDAFDHFVMLAQQQQDQIDGCVRLNEVLDPADFDMTLPADIADNGGNAIIVNDTGDGLAFGFSALNESRIFNTLSFAEFKALTATTPTLQRFCFISEAGLQALMFYCGDVSVGDEGCIWLAGAGGSPGSGGPI